MPLKRITSWPLAARRLNLQRFSLLQLKGSKLFNSANPAASFLVQSTVFHFLALYPRLHFTTDQQGTMSRRKASHWWSCRTEVMLGWVMSREMYRYRISFKQSCPPFPGPHSVFSDTFVPELALFLNLGRIHLASLYY